MTKKNRVLELSKQEPKLSRSEIARKAGCSAPFVTECLGAVRTYKRKAKPEKVLVTNDHDADLTRLVLRSLCPGCLDENCKLNGCMA